MDYFKMQVDQQNIHETVKHRVKSHGFCNSLFVYPKHALALIVVGLLYKYLFLVGTL